MFIFTDKIIKGEPIDVFNMGHHARDFTYIDDIVQGVVRLCDRIATPNPSWSSDDPDPATSSAPYRIYNIGNHTPVQLLDYIACIEKAVGKTAKKNMLPMQPGDVPATFADVERPQGRYRLRADDADRGRGRTVCGVVPRLLSPLEPLNEAAFPAFWYGFSTSETVSGRRHPHEKICADRPQACDFGGASLFRHAQSGFRRCRGAVQPSASRCGC